MRVSTMQMNHTMQNGMTSTMSSMSRILMELESGKKNLTPSDDTLASTQILALKDANSALGSYEGSMKNVKNSLAMAETTIKYMVNDFNRVRDLTLSIGGLHIPEGRGGTSAQVREIEMLMESLKGLANTKSSSGEYIFAGTKGDTPPVKTDKGSTAIGGSDSHRKIQISDSQTADVGVVAKELFSLGGGSNIFQVMDDFATKISDPALSTKDRDDLLADTIKAIDGALGNLNQSLTKIGGTINTVDKAMAANKDMQNNNTMMIDNMERVDFSKATTEYSMLQAQYINSQKAFAMVSGTSLFDYVYK